MTEKYTKYEKARMIGARALQIERGAPILIKTEETDPIKIAEQEFEAGVLPFEIKRKLPKKVETQ